jgi:cation:H+ antiporter
VILRYTVDALVVVGMGTWLPFIGETMATVMGWHKTFVGTLFIAFATSVPEVSVTVAASRIGALDMAIGNLLGSNLFDMMIVAVDDIFFLNGPILSHVSPLHAVSAMMMTGLTVVGLLYRPKTRVFWRVGWTSLALLTLYMLNALVLFLYER